MIGGIQLVCAIAIITGLWMVVSGRDARGHRSETVGEWLANALRATFCWILPAVVVWWILASTFGFSTPD